MQAHLRTATLSDALFPRVGAAQTAILLVAATAVMALCAQVTIYLPVSPVPITGQTFGVLLIGAALGSRRGAAAMLLYLGEGLVGLPVFAQGTTLGLARLLGPSGGYLIGFVAAAFVAGWLAERGWFRQPLTAVLALAAADAALYLFGLPWLVHFVGWDKVLPLGLFLYIPGDLLKLALAGLLLPGASALVAARGR